MRTFVKFLWDNFVISFIYQVRGYSFDINSGAIESLELDSFGISIIPSSLVGLTGYFGEMYKERIEGIECA